MMNYNEAEQARLKHYIEPSRKDGRDLWAVVRLNDKKIVGWYTTRSLAKTGSIAVRGGQCVSRAD